MSTRNIYSALKQQLALGSFGVDIVYPNTSYTAVDGNPYCNVFIIPAQPVSGELGTNKAEKIDGIMQLDLYFPLEQGDGAMLDCVDLLKDTFQMGITFEYNGTCVRIESAGANESPDVVEGRFKQMFDITWSAYEIN